MKIIIAHSRYRTTQPSGENLVVDQEAELLRAGGHEVRLFERRSDDIGSWSLTDKAAVPLRVSRNRGVRRALTEVLADEHADVLHVHNTFPLLSPSVLLAARDVGVPVVFTLHNYKLLCASGDFFREGTVCHECAGGKLLPGVRHGCYRGSRVATGPVSVGLAANRHLWRELVSAYVFISEAQRDLMRALELPADRVFVKHNFVSSRPYEEVSQREHFVTYLGRLDAAKGVPFLMRSWDAFRDEHPTSTLRLVIAGGGPLEDLVRRWAASNKSVEYVGLLFPEEAARLLRRALATVIPSQWEETFGLVAAEAMSAGVAAVAPAQGSFPELVTNGFDGALFTPHDPQDLVRVLRQVDRHPERYMGYGRHGRLTYQARFTPDTSLKQLLDVYRFAIAHPVGSTRSND